MKTDLIIIGAGGHAQDITHHIRDINYYGESGVVYDIIGYLSDDPDYFNNKFDVLGPISSIETLAKVRYFQYVIAINDSKKRKEIYNRYISKLDISGAYIKHPSANVPLLASLGRPDVVIGPMVYVAPGTSVGYGVHINSASTVNQGCKIGNWTTISPGVNVCGDIEIGECVQVGAGSTIINYKKIGHDVTIGAGSVVISDIVSGSTVVGVPARSIGER